MTRRRVLDPAAVYQVHGQCTYKQLTVALHRPRPQQLVARLELALNITVRRHALRRSTQRVSIFDFERR